MTQAQEAAPKPRKPRPKKPTQVEQRLFAGAQVMKSMTKDGIAWTFTDTGRTARADICERLIRDGRLLPNADGLFADDSQTWGFS